VALGAVLTKLFLIVSAHFGAMRIATANIPPPLSSLLRLKMLLAGHKRPAILVASEEATRRKIARLLWTPTQDVAKDKRLNLLMTPKRITLASSAGF
jgi:hypothetical protein